MKASHTSEQVIVAVLCGGTSWSFNGAGLTLGGPIQMYNGCVVLCNNEGDIWGKWVTASENSWLKRQLNSVNLELAPIVLIWLSCECNYG